MARTDALRRPEQGLIHQAESKDLASKPPLDVLKETNMSLHNMARTCALLTKKTVFQTLRNALKSLWYKE
jgi:hypothetical protein